MPEHEHTPLTDRDVEGLISDFEYAHCWSSEFVKRALLDLREARRLLRAVGDEISRHLNDAHSGDHADDYPHLEPGDSTLDLALCLDMEVHRYLAACEGKEQT